MGNSGRAPDLPPDPPGPWGAAQGTASPAALKTKTAVKCAAASPPAAAAAAPAARPAAAPAVAAGALAVEAAGAAAAGAAVVALAAALAAGAAGAAAAGPAAAARRGAAARSAASLRLFARPSEALRPVRGGGPSKASTCHRWRDSLSPGHSWLPRQRPASVLFVDEGLFSIARPGVSRP